MKYLVLKNNFGFQKRYWAEGQVVDLPEGANPPEHFKLLDKPEEEKTEPKTFSDLANKTVEYKSLVASVDEEKPFVTVKGSIPIETLQSLVEAAVDHIENKETVSEEQIMPKISEDSIVEMVDEVAQASRGRGRPRNDGK